MEEIVEPARSKGKSLGTIDDAEVSLLNGKFGAFISWRTTKRNVQSLIDEGKEITIDVARDLLSSKKTKCIIRELGPDCSVRTGQYGDYIYYKTQKMSKPRFIPVKGYDGDYKEDSSDRLMEWISSKVAPSK